MENETMTSNTVSVKWRCPSNIAIVKYWGKYGDQLPCNPSVSLTLNNSYTEVSVELQTKSTDDPIALTYYFEGERNASFEARVITYLSKHAARFPFLKDHAIVMHSTNSFPHSAGIASSASAFGAIALALLDIAYQLEGKAIDAAFYREASDLARLGSGSACRSLFPAFSAWGEVKGLNGASNLNATPVSDVHPTFQNMHDAILIVDDEPKKVSSSVGHGLMNNHPYASARFEQAQERSAALVEILRNGDMDAFISMCESEALTLHAMMMTSADYYLLVKPNTIALIEKIMEFRRNKGVPVCFTLDAGPNLHVLYPNDYQSIVEDFIKNDLQDSYKNAIFDHEGQGPQKLNL